MKPTSTALNNLLASRQFITADLYQITLRNKTKLYYTSATVDTNSEVEEVTFANDANADLLSGLVNNSGGFLPLSSAPDARGPDGLFSAWTITLTSDSNPHQYYCDSYGPLDANRSKAGTQLISAYVKMGTQRYVWLNNAPWVVPSPGGSGAAVIFDLQTGTITETHTQGGTTIDSATITPAANGFYKLTLGTTSTDAVDLAINGMGAAIGSTNVGTGNTYGSFGNPQTAYLGAGQTFYLSNFTFPGRRPFSCGGVQTNPFAALLHFDGTDGSRSFQDSSAPDRANWIAANNAQIDTAQSKFGGSSLLCSANGDYVYTPTRADMEIGDKDFNFRLWFKIDGVAANGEIDLTYFLGPAFNSNEIPWFCRRVVPAEFPARPNAIEIGVQTGQPLGQQRMRSASQYTNAVNTGWNFLRIKKRGLDMKMEINGAVEATMTLPTTTIDTAIGGLLAVGAVSASFAGGYWIDDFVFEVGFSDWDNLSVPLSAEGDRTYGPYFDRKSNRAKVKWNLGVGSDDLTIDVLPGNATVLNLPFLSAMRAGAFDGADFQLSRGFMRKKPDQFVQALLSFDGANNSTTFTDSARVPATWAAFFAGPGLDTARKKFGSASLKTFDQGIFAPTSTRYHMSDGEWAIEGHFYNNSNLAHGFDSIAWIGIPFTTTNQFDLTRNGVTGTLIGSVYKSSDQSLVSVSSTSQFSSTVNVGWHEFLWQRRKTSTGGDFLELFIDGIQEGGSVSVGGSSIYGSTNNLTIGSHDTAGGNGWQGWIDNFRLSIGCHRADGNYAPHVAPFEGETVYPVVEPGCSVLMFRGRVAEAQATRSVGTLTVNDYRELLNQQMPRNLFAAGCANTLYDASCTVNPNSFSTASVAVGAASSAQYINVTLSQAAGYYDLGKATFTSGSLSGLSFGISSWDGTKLSFIAPLSPAPSSGDTLTVFPGCDRSTGANGCTKFSNINNFRGFPYVPDPLTAV